MSKLVKKVFNVELIPADEVLSALTHWGIFLHERHYTIQFIQTLAITLVVSGTVDHSSEPVSLTMELANVPDPLSIYLGLVHNLLYIVVIFFSR